MRIWWSGESYRAAIQSTISTSATSAAQRRWKRLESIQNITGEYHRWKTKNWSVLRKKACLMALNWGKVDNSGKKVHLMPKVSWAFSPRKIALATWGIPHVAELANFSELRKSYAKSEWRKEFDFATKRVLYEWGFTPHQIFPKEKLDIFCT